MDGYPEGVERLMRRLFGSLKESDRRRYAAIEAAKLGHGGTEYIATVLGCDPRRSGWASPIWRGRPSWIPGVPAKGGRAQAADRD